MEILLGTVVGPSLVSKIATCLQAGLVGSVTYHASAACRVWEEEKRTRRQKEAASFLFEFAAPPSMKEPLPNSMQVFELCQDATILGRGGQATVYSVAWYGKQIAIKACGVEEMRHELSILSEVSRTPHGNIVSLLGAVESPLTGYLLFEQAAGDLYSRCRLKRAFGCGQRICALRDALRGLGHLHRCYILHRDIKTQNILCFGRDEVTAKLTDFGHAVMASDMVAPMLQGTAGYIDPRVRQAGYFVPANDIYSAGVCGLEVLVGRPPAYTSKSGTVTLRFTEFEGDADRVLRKVDVEIWGPAVARDFTGLSLLMIEDNPPAVDAIAMYLANMAELHSVTFSTVSGR